MLKSSILPMHNHGYKSSILPMYNHGYTILLTDRQEML